MSVGRTTSEEVRRGRTTSGKVRVSIINLSPWLTLLGELEVEKP